MTLGFEGGGKHGISTPRSRRGQDNGDGDEEMRRQTFRKQYTAGAGEVNFEYSTQAIEIKVPIMLVPRKAENRDVCAWKSVFVIL